MITHILLSLPLSLLPPPYRFNPPLPETTEPIETDSAKLCDLVIKAKQLLQKHTQDLLVQHFYYTAVKSRQAK